MAVQIQLRRGTASAWTSADPTLAQGEVGYETDTGKAKIGDGSTAWTGLSYATFGAQTQGDVLDDLITLGAAASDGQFIVATGAGAFAYESGATARASLGLTIGTHVQAYDADLDTWAGLTPSANFQTLVTETFAQIRASLDLEAGTDFYSISAADAAIAAAVANYTLTTDLASTANAKGASLIGIEDAGGLITAATVEGALAENRTAIDAIEADYLVAADIANMLESSDIGVSVQAYDADLTTWAGLTPSANAQSLVTAANYAAMRALLDLEAGTDFLSPAAIAAAYQPLDAGLTSIAGLTTAADRMIYTTASDTYAVATLTSFARSILDDADEATFKATVNLEIGTDVQAYDADTLKADTADQLTAAFTMGVDDDGTKSSSSYTPSVAAGSNAKKIINGGAFTLVPPSPVNDEVIDLILFIANNGSAGAITTSGFTMVVGDAFTTTNGHEFRCRIEVWDIGGTEFSVLEILALQ